MVNPRFFQLLDLAREGDQNAVSDLWKEFDFDFHAETASDTCHPTPDTHPPEGGTSC
jgi:hypothetical protein